VEAKEGTGRVRFGVAAPAGQAAAERRAHAGRGTRVADTTLDRLSRRIARTCDDVLDFLVLAFAAWTVVYHVCLVLRIGTVWAAVAGAALLVPSGWVAFRQRETTPEGRWKGRAPAGLARRVPVLAAVNLAGATSAAALFAFTDAPWWSVWPLWAATAGSAALVTIAGRRELQDAPLDVHEPAWLGSLVALMWAAGLGTLSLFVVRPSSDDTQYLHLSSWIAEHGEFPLRDILFTDQALPAITYPPLSSVEALAGTVARASGLTAPDVVYLGVTPLASALAVLAAWRLLRNWSVPMVGLALSVAMVFLLMDGEKHRALGNLFITRLWQGKIVFLTVLVPVLFVLLSKYARRPSRRQLMLLAAAGAAGVGLTSTSVIITPVVAAGCLLPLALRSRKEALAGFAATVAYPLGAGAVSLGVGARNADEYTDSDVAAGRLVHFVLGDGALAFVGVIALLVGPTLIRRASAAQMTASTGLLVACLFAPALPALVFHLTDLGQVLWRWMWAVPLAALVGVLATALSARIRRPPLKALPAVLICAAFVLLGTPVWTAARTTVEAEPAWKRSTPTIAAAQRILDDARPGDVILAPREISQTVLVLSGNVTAVAPRLFYTEALRGVPGAHAEERLLLLRFAENGLRPVEGSSGQPQEVTEVARALRLVGVDIACTPNAHPEARQLLLASGYSPVAALRNVSCLRAPEVGR
jgi:Family of unknown function (DUF6077)